MIQNQRQMKIFSRVQIPLKGTRKKFSPDVRKLLYIHAGGRCELCGREIALEDVTIDHLKPLAMGGTNDVSNLACTCFGCNHLKGSAVPESFFQRVNDIFMFQMEKKYKRNVWWSRARDVRENKLMPIFISNYKLYN